MTQASRAKIDELAARELDEAAPQKDADYAALAPDERARLADLIWLDTLLAQMARPERWQAERDRRVGRVLAQLAQEPLVETPAPVETATDSPVPLSAPATLPFPARSTKPAARRSGGLWWSGLLTAAAALMIAFLLRSGSPRAQAYAAVEQVVAFASKPVDRQYRAQVELLGGHRTESMLFVRGGEKFCLKQPAPLGDVWLGGDRQQSWLVPALPFLPVRVSRDPMLIREFLREGDVSLTPQVLQVTSILSRLADRDRYELELIEQPDANRAPARDVDSATTASLARIHGKRRGPSMIWPATIDLWADPQSGQMKRMVLDWGHGMALERVTLELAGERPQPENWYEHDAHHLPGRTVIEGPLVELRK